MYRRLICLLTPLLFASCSGGGGIPDGFSTTEDLTAAYAKPPVRYSKVEVSGTVVSDGKNATLPKLTLRGTRSGSTGLIEKVKYPTDYDFPEIPAMTSNDDSPSVFPVTPAKPKAFRTTEVGWTLKLRARPRGGFIMLEGELTHKKAAPLVRAAGVPFQPVAVEASDILGRKTPVIITENRAEQPAITTTVYPIRIAATPGESFSVALAPGAIASFEVNVPR